MTQASGGVLLTRARLDRVLAGMPVVVSCTERDRPWRWAVRHKLEGVLHLHPYNTWSPEQIRAAVDPGVEAAAVALAEAGYHVLLGPHPDPVELDELPEHLRRWVDITASRLHLRLVPDDA